MNVWMRNTKITPCETHIFFKQMTTSTCSKLLLTNLSYCIRSNWQEKYVSFLSYWSSHFLSLHYFINQIWLYFALKIFTYLIIFSVISTYHNTLINKYNKVCKLLTIHSSKDIIHGGSVKQVSRYLFCMIFLGA